MVTTGRRTSWLFTAVAITFISCVDAGHLTEPGVTHRDGPVPAATVSVSGLPALEWREPVRSDVVVSAEIGAKGGVLRANGVELNIPRGALKHPTTIRLAIPAGRFTHVHLMPHGLQFRLPVELSFDLTRTNGAHLSGEALLGTYFTQNIAASGLVVPLETFVMIVEGYRASMWITHFSKYAPTRRGYTSAGA